MALRCHTRAFAAAERFSFPPSKSSLHPENQSAGCFLHRPEIAKRQLLKAVFTKGRRYYAAWIFEACLPLGPVVTSKETFWPSFKVLKPSMLIAEKCANKSSPPSSGVIKPKPLASLNHLTIPVAIECYFLYFLKDTNEKTAKVIQLTRRYSAWWLPVFRWLLFYLF